MFIFVTNVKINDKFENNFFVTANYSEKITYLYFQFLYLVWRYIKDSTWYAEFKCVLFLFIQDIEISFGIADKLDPGFIFAKKNLQLIKIVWFSKSIEVKKMIGFTCTNQFILCLFNNIKLKIKDENQFLLFLFQFQNIRNNYIF